MDSIPNNAIHLGKMKLGDWQLILHVNNELTINDEPQMGLSMLYHSENKQYISRVWGRTIETGTVSNYNEVLAKCVALFRKGTPCIGMNPPDERFPLSCEFAKNCIGFVPRDQDSNVCVECKKTNHETKTEEVDPLCFEIEEHAVKLEYSVDAPTPAFQCGQCSKVFNSAKDMYLHGKSCPNVRKVLLPIKRIKPMNERTEEPESPTDPLGLKIMKVQHSSKIHDKSSDSLNEEMLPKRKNVELSPSHDKTSTSEKLEKRPLYGTSECPICKKHISSVFLAIHKMYYHEVGDFRCRCGVSCQTAQDLMIHLEIKHPHDSITILRCPNCKIIIDIKDGPSIYVDHVKECRKIKYLTDVKGKLVRMDRFCVDCRMPFASIEELQSHEANDCDTKGNPRAIFEPRNTTHKEVKENPQPILNPESGNFVCSVCNLEFGSQNLLKTHKTSMHPPDCHVCEECGLKFNVLSQLRSHKSKVHPESNAFVCDVCGVGFDNSQVFFKHKKGHLMQKHKCQICDKEYKLLSLFEKHMRSHR